MKRTERHHLKENELRTFARHARETVDSRRRESTAIIVLLVVVSAIAAGYFGWREHVRTKAHALLAEAMTVQDARIGPPPAPGTPAGGLYFPTERERWQAALTKFKIAADAYPSSDAGIYARYQEAALSLALGSPTQAAAAYQRVIASDGAFKELAQRKDGPLPVDGILMQLGRTYLDAGKRADAQQTFNRLIEEYPESPFTGDAKRELDTLKKT